jgi:diadenosine tetraphosphatase ApaH/serine/threonine PP2A family protein phosphatase
LRVAVVSDVHANLHALEAVLAEVDRGGFDEIWCLGDVVGYGPKPNECVALVQERTAICLAGNHDLVVLGKIALATFGGEAGAAAAWTREVLDAPARGFLTTLAPSAVTTGAELFHGSPRDPVWDYVLTEDAARWTLAATTAPLVLVGHSHIALELAGDGTGVRGGQAAAGTTLDLAAARRLLNPGSVGQPRDGDPRAAWLEVDTSAGRATFRRTDYPVERTQAEMRELDLPEVLAARLEHGI